MLCICVLQEPSIHFHQAKLEGTLTIWDVCPPLHGRVHLSKLCTFRDPAHRLLLLESNVSKHFPPHVKLALVLVRPSAGDVVRPMSSSRSKVDEEGAVWSESTVVPDELDCLGGQVLCEVIPLFRCVRRFDGVRVLIQARFVLRCLTRKETIEVAESQACRVHVKRSGPEQVIDRSVVPLTKSRGVVPIAREHLGNRCCRFRDSAAVAGKSGSQLSDLAAPNGMRIPPSQERGSGGRANRMVVEAVVGHACRCNSR
mmetsp:Transcript_89103/g.224978  ORF Transcript_89103/g.224978 Transcript_89103/m.224978 type:complete len:256 (-) Transcript_89103:362-1129(-)